MDWQQELDETGAHLKGHFELASGLHSAEFVLLARLTAHPQRVRRWLAPLRAFAEPLRPTAVVGPAMGGVVLAWALAESLAGTVWAGFAEKTAGGGMAMRRGFTLSSADRVVVAEDALTTGGSVLKTMAAVEEAGAQVVGVVALVDRRPDGVSLAVPFCATYRMAGLPAYRPAECPLCLAGAGPAIRPKGR